MENTSKYYGGYWETETEINNYINRIIRYDDGEVYINNYEPRYICDIFTEMM